jgi:hypothetical protein
VGFANVFAGLIRAAGAAADASRVSDAELVAREAAPQYGGSRVALKRRPAPGADACCIAKRSGAVPPASKP